jgi:hypothetical protein
MSIDNKEVTEEKAIVLTDQQAADFYQALVHDTLDVVRTVHNKAVPKYKVSLEIIPGMTPFETGKTVAEISLKVQLGINGSRRIVHSVAVNVERMEHINDPGVKLVLYKKLHQELMHTALLFHITKQTEEDNILVGAQTDK